ARRRRPGRRILRLRQRRLPRSCRGGQTPGLPCRRAWRVPVPQRPNQRVRGLLVNPARQPAGRPGRRRRRRQPGPPIPADDDEVEVAILVDVGWDGRPRLLRNDGGNVSQYVKVRLVGLREGSGKNNTFGLGATLELRAGDLYQLRLVTDRVTHFGLGRRLKADVLRVRWPNGVSQTVYYPGTEEDVLEQQILKGSCPFLYAWDGHAFTFATDAMWNSALGMPLGIMTREGGILSASPHASQEYLRIPSGLLRPRDGRYELRLTEELWETAYLDEA